MNDQGYFRKAVGLADEWGFLTRTGGEYIQTPEGYECPSNAIPKEIQDAIAAQLVRQVDAIEHIYIELC